MQFSRNGGGRRMRGLLWVFALGLAPGVAAQVPMPSWMEASATHRSILRGADAWDVERIVTEGEAVAVVRVSEDGTVFPLGGMGGATLLDLHVDESLQGAWASGSTIRFVEPPWTTHHTTAIGPEPQIVFLRRLTGAEREEVDRAIEEEDLGLPASEDPEPLRALLRLPEEAWTLVTPDDPWQSWIGLSDAGHPGRLGAILREVAGVTPGPSAVDYVRRLLALRDLETDLPPPEERDPLQERVLAMPPGG
jgi:hypothetical protein